MVITNNPGLIFKSLRYESWRVYDFSTGRVTIKDPIALHVSASGGHRIVDKAGTSHYIPPGWLHLYWSVKKGKPNFSF